VNRPGSFSCTCPNSGITGKLCQFDEKKDCEGKCEQGETCYPKETENQLGYECITNVRTVSMVYQLDSNQLPFEDWMIYDVAQNVENTIVNNGLNGVSQEDQGMFLFNAVLDITIEETALGVVQLAEKL
jgi:hypothetical protein